MTTSTLRTGSLKVYRRHHCTRAHRTNQVFARCIWKWAHWVAGEGQFASVSRCRGTTVALYERLEHAEQAKRVIDSSACGGACSRRHEIVRLDLANAIGEGRRR